MKTQIKHPERVSHVIQSKTKASRQAPIEQILQSYSGESRKVKGENAVQREAILDEDELFDSGESGKMKGESLQRQENSLSPFTSHHSPKNETGLPDNLKSGIENHSGYSMDDVRVHYNSPKPAQLQALAYTQGTDIHVAPGQEKHLPHEAWHVVQQMQGRVQPTMQLQGVNINDNEGLEREADSISYSINRIPITPILLKKVYTSKNITQRAIGFEFETGWHISKNNSWIKKLFGAQEFIPLKKKEIIYRGNNFNMEADEAGPNNSEIEFVTQPIENLIGLNQVMTAINQTANNLNAHRNNPNFRLSIVNGFGQQYQNYQINLPGGVLGEIISANPQITAGLRLDRIHQLSINAGTPGDFARTSLFSMDNEVTANRFSQAGNSANNIQNQELRGLATIIISYINESKKPNNYDGLTSDYKWYIALPYAKHTTLLMARTNLINIFGGINNQIKQQYIQNPQLFVNLIINQINGLNANDFLFGKGIRVHEEPDENLIETNPQEAFRLNYQNNITIGNWLTGIVNDIDITSNDHYWFWERHTDFESMGALGNRRDNVNQHQVPIFEFRKVQTNMPYTQWQNWSLLVFNYINQLNQ